MFKKGDKVIGDDEGSMCYGRTFVVREDQESTLVKLREVCNDNLTSFSSHKLKLVDEVKKVKKPSSRTDYTFVCKDMGMVCPDEVEISRVHPIAVIQAKGYNVLYVHGSLINKMDALDIDIPDGDDYLDESYIIRCKSCEELGKHLGTLKAALKAPWPKDTKEIQVRVKLIGSN